MLTQCCGQLPRGDVVDRMLASIDEDDRDELAIPGGQVGIIGDRHDLPADPGVTAYRRDDHLGHVTEVAAGPAVDDDPMLVFDLTDQVRETIQQTLYSLLMLRRSVFS